MAKYAIAVFSAAFLLFQIQPIVAKYILPWFGGASAVWTICLVFFQSFLLLGYTYAHLLSKLGSVTKQALIHTGLVTVSAVLFLPIQPDAALSPVVGADPTFGILQLLLLTVGLPYALISSSGPLLQSWFQYNYPRGDTYRLYALSNLGSLLGLVSYPLIVEPNLDLNEQTKLWSFGFVAYLVLCAACFWSLKNNTQGISLVKKLHITEGDETKPRLADTILWCSLAATASILLLATTNQITQDIASVPFLWLIPLSLYLISFIICFEKPNWYKRRVWVVLLIFSIAAGIIALFKGSFATFFFQIFGYTFILFVGCMVCHGELYRKRPSPKYLTLFYLTLSLGGAIGGLSVALIAPLIFSGYWELHISWLLLFFLVGLCIFGSVEIKSRIMDLGAQAAWTIMCVVIGLFLYVDTVNKDNKSLHKERGFYGVLTVTDYAFDDHESVVSQNMRVLKSGTIVHGTQLITGGKAEFIPTTYYGEGSGIGISIREQANINTERVNVGIVGMGAATIASLCSECASVTFFEIDPNMIEIEDKYFANVSELSSLNVTAESVLGDGRVSLANAVAKATPYKFDVLAVDAFSGDAIPVHLLTHEAFEVYVQNLQEGGVLAIHVSNRHMELSPIVARIAKEMDMSVFRLRSKGDAKKVVFQSDWMIITNSQSFIEKLSLPADCEVSDIDATPLWTDQYSNILRVLGRKSNNLGDANLQYGCY